MDFSKMGDDDLIRTVVTSGSSARTCSDFGRARTSPIISG